MEQNYLLFMNRNNNSRNNNISQVNFHSYQDESNEDKNNILISSKLDADESNPKIIDNFESLKYLLSTPLLIGNDILKENKRKERGLIFSVLPFIWMVLCDFLCV